MKKKGCLKVTKCRLEAALADIDWKSVGEGRGCCSFWTVFDELSEEEATVFDNFDFCLEQVDLKTGASQNSDEAFSVSSEA